MIVLANPEDCEQVRHPDDILNLAQREGEEAGLRDSSRSQVSLLILNMYQKISRTTSQDLNLL